MLRGKKKIKANVHTIRLGHGADMVGSTDGTDDGGLSFVISKALALKVRAAALGDLDDDGS